MTVYSCWICEQEADPKIHDRHYETGEMIFFCSTEHWYEHQQLKGL